MLGRITSFIRRFRGDADIDDLKRRGLCIGGGCSIQPQVTIDRSHCWLISIGDNVTIAPHAYILAHDASTKRYLGYTRIGLVTIEDDVFIGAGSIVLPGVRIGRASIVGAGSVVTHDVEEGTIVAGNPAHKIGEVGDYLRKQREAMERVPVFDRSYTIAKHANEQKKREMKRLLSEVKGHCGFVE